LRWNDYGIGLFLQGDLKGAANAWTRVAEIAPEKPDGALNRARAEIAEGRLADATESLALAEKVRPNWPKTAFFRSIVARDEGRLDDAERDLRPVLAKFPLDRVAWNSLGQVLWLAGRFPEAVTAYEKTLQIDPEDLNAHYNLMRVFRAVKDRRRAALHAAAYRRHKEDETGRAIAAELRLRDPWANRESLPIHVHEESVPPEAPAPSWVASIGRKGYETDFGYLTRAHPPIRRDPVLPAAGAPAPARSRPYSPAGAAQGQR
jgi:tetratricopeptide (TPR) repeat protein